MGRVKGGQEMSSMSMRQQRNDEDYEKVNTV